LSFVEFSLAIERVCLLW